MTPRPARTPSVRQRAEPATAAPTVTVVPLRDAGVTPDPENARRHTPRNIGVIEDSMKATAPEVTDLRKENGRLKQLVAEIVLENRLLKKSVTASDSGDDTCD